MFALATPPGRSGVAVMRLSGPDAFEAAARLCPRGLPAPREAAVRWLEWDGIRIDEALVLVFPSPRSFTGEDVVELQTHGSPAVIRELTRILGGMDGLTPAGPGEFTRRALMNGRLSISQVEGLGDLLEAETLRQHRQSLSLFAGEAGRRAEGWRAKLLEAMALYETMIDFVDDDVPSDLAERAEAVLEELRGELGSALTQAQSGASVREGFDVAIVGLPNAGKSSLINALSGRKSALVSASPGTTRDVIELRYDLGGLPVTFLDTAGLRDAVDQVEAEGVALAVDRASAASMRLFLSPPDSIPAVQFREGDLMRRGFSDRDPEGQFSALTGEGVGNLLADVKEKLEERLGEPGPFTRHRHAALLAEALSALQGPDDPELRAEGCRRAGHALDELIGRVGTETVLSEIFSSFCIGK